jgi:hypothetical protein
MFRRFRQRRAMRLQEKKNAKQIKSSSSTIEQSTSMLLSSSSKNGIFRSANSTMSFSSVPVIQSQPTVESTFDEYNEETKVDQQPHPTIVQSTSFGILLEDILSDHKIKNDDNSNNTSADRELVLDAKNKMPKTMYDIRSVLDEINDELFYYDTTEIHDELMNTNIELGFVKESYDEMKHKLHSSQTIIERQQLELMIGRMVLNYTQNELHTTKDQFHQSVSALVKSKLLILSLQEQIQKRDDEIHKLQKTIQNHHRSVQVLASLITFGAIMKSDQ